MGIQSRSARFRIVKNLLQFNTFGQLSLRVAIGIFVSWVWFDFKGLRSNIRSRNKIKTFHESRINFDTILLRHKEWARWKRYTSNVTAPDSMIGLGQILGLANMLEQKRSRKKVEIKRVLKWCLELQNSFSKGCVQRKVPWVSSVSLPWFPVNWVVV